MKLKTRLKINISELNPALDDVLLQFVSFSVSYISTSFISDYTNTENPQPITPSIWKMDYMINPASINLNSPFVEEIFQMIQDYMQQWVIDNAGATILFHSRFY